MDKLVYEMFYSISIDGNPLSIEMMSLIESVELEDNASGSDLLTLTIVDPEYKYIGSKSLLIEDKPVSFEGGWKDDVSLTFDGYISVVDINFPETGSPVLVLHCMDGSHKMNRKKKKRTWNKMRESDVAKKIFAEYGLKADVDPTAKVEDTISQSNVTDIDFLTSLKDKQEDDYLVYVKDGVGYFKKKQYISIAQDTLVYGKFPFDIKSFSPRVNKEDKMEEVESGDINSLNKKPEKIVVNNSNIVRDTQGEAVSTSSSKVKKNTPSKQTLPKPPSKDSSKSTAPAPVKKYDPKTGKWSYKKVK